MEKKEKDEEIRNRESWVKTIVLIGLTVVVVWKLITSQWTFDLTGFKFTDLLSLILAIFAIAMSVAFYFKATETSNIFYDNTYKFTQDISEILGRIEAGFGERLRHLDEGYSGLRDRFERVKMDTPKVQKEIKEEEEEVKKIQKERDQLIEQVAVRAKLEEDQKKEFIKKLREKDEELINAKRELTFYKTRLSYEGKHGRGIALEKRRLPDNYYINLINTLGGKSILEIPTDAIQRRFMRIIDDVPKVFIKDLEISGLIDDKFLLTERGIKILKDIARYEFE